MVGLTEPRSRAEIHGEGFGRNLGQQTVRLDPRARSYPDVNCGAVPLGLSPEMTARRTDFKWQATSCFSPATTLGGRLQADSYRVESPLSNMEEMSSHFCFLGTESLSKATL